MTNTLLDLLGDAVVAPSANRFGHVSPTSAQHVVDDLGDSVDLVLDGGQCTIGVESTIVECTNSSVQILRPGKVSALEIAKVTGLGISLTDGPSRAPGMLLAHYAPRARVELFDSLPEAQDSLNQHISDGQSVEILHYDDPTTYALSLYDDLRAADLRSREIVLAVMPLDNGLGTAIRDRLAKAAAAG
jgi:L-threonylcarbamoyladenylate synthase